MREYWLTSAIGSRALEAAKKIELGDALCVEIHEAYTKLMADLEDIRFKNNIYYDSKLRHIGAEASFLQPERFSKKAVGTHFIQLAHMYYITNALTLELEFAESDGALGENVDTETIDIYYIAIADLLEKTVSVFGDLSAGFALTNLVGREESALPTVVNGKDKVTQFIASGACVGWAWAFYEFGDTDRFLFVSPNRVDKDDLLQQMFEVWLGGPETLLDRARYAYGLCDPCHEPINWAWWSLRNRECEQAYKLQPICGEYGESIFSLSEYASENITYLTL